MKCNSIITASLALAATVSALPAKRDVWSDLNGKASLLTDPQHVAGNVDVICTLDQVCYLPDDGKSLL
jgi:hypothetical protein